MAGSYIREVQLFIGPLTEIQGGGDPNQAILIKSSGLSSDLNISFRVQKSIMGTPGFASIVVYNLTNETKQVLAKSKTNILLQAGYQQGENALQTIAQGAIASTQSERDGGDIKTTIISYDGLQGMGLAVSNKNYAKQVQLATIVKDLASDIKGVAVNTDEIKLDDTLQTGTKGMSLSGKTTDLLADLAHQYGFSWSVQSGVFKAVPDITSTGNIYDISSADGNLIHATPVISNVLQQITGVEITSVLDPRIQPYDFVNLTSTVNPQLNNKYYVQDVVHTGETHGEQWVTVIKTLLNPSQFEN